MLLHAKNQVNIWQKYGETEDYGSVVFWLGVYNTQKCATAWPGISVPMGAVLLTLMLIHWSNGECNAQVCMSSNSCFTRVYCNLQQALADLLDNSKAQGI